MIDYIKAFAENDRRKFPHNMVNVTAGMGGDGVLVFGSEKTALMDCGMAYCGDKFVSNIKKALAEKGGKSVDYIFLSHSHYDHVGALPYVLDRWPQAKVCASEKTKYIFSREGAIKLMKELGEAARDEYTDSKAEIRTDGLRVDIVLADNDTIKLGKETVRALETKGHTDCSMSYAVEPQKVLFTSESTGVVVPQKAYVSSEILKSMADSLAACDKCEAYAPEIIICPHYGVVPKVFNKEYFKSMKADAERKKSLVKEFADRGMNEEEILEAYRDKLYEPGEQPLSAFLENAANVIRVMLKEINKD